MPIYNVDTTKLLVCVKDLIWGPLGEEIRFVAVIHPRRGRVVLMSTDKTLSAEEIIRAYSLHFKIESGFKSAKYGDHGTAKILASKMAPERFPGLVMGQKLCA